MNHMAAALAVFRAVQGYERVSVGERAKWRKLNPHLSEWLKYG